MRAEVVATRSLLSRVSVNLSPHKCDEQARNNREEQTYHQALAIGYKVKLLHKLHRGWGHSWTNDDKYRLARYKWSLAQTRGGP